MLSTARTSKFTVSPPVGTPVMFYEFADLHSAPKGAYVVEAGSQGIIGVIILDKYGGTNLYKASVYHVSAPALWDQNGNPTQAALRNGTWDYHPWFRPPVECSFAEPKKPAPGVVTRDTVTAHEKKEHKILQLAREGHSVDEVFHKVKYLGGITRADVESVFVKFELMAAPPLALEEAGVAAGSA